MVLQAEGERWQESFNLTAGNTGYVLGLSTHRTTPEIQYFYAGKHATSQTHLLRIKLLRNICLALRLAAIAF